MASPITQFLIREFKKHPRIVGPNPAGTMPVDRKIFEQAIRETLANKEVLQNLVNVAIKQVDFKVK